ncbi:MAG: aldehyde dehydrogenase family protein [Methanomassiliicoccus sp.]|nr:aldehyde dehydrogenase family protein [Methanomassiliicoccus sp.]
MIYPGVPSFDERLITVTFRNEDTYQRLAMQGDGESFHSGYERAAERLLAQVQEVETDYPNHIDGKPRLSERQFHDLSPGDEEIVVGLFQNGTADDADEAVRSSREAFRTWSREDWGERVHIFEKAADLMRRSKYELAAAITLDNGKNRYEAMADVDEALDFIAYYCGEMRRSNGFERVSDPPYPEEEVTVSLRPYGAWAVICPFNFPLAITVGMTTGALLTGNTVVMKPSSTAPLPVQMFYEIMYRAGIPDGVINMVSGPGSEVGGTLAHHPLIDGVVFTGSLQVGLDIMTSQPWRQRPVIAEMGSKNPIIVTQEADLDAAARGVIASAFGYSGQKCSACSRLYAHETIFEPLLDKMVELADGLVVGDPFERDTFMGPVITKTALDNYLRWSEAARKDGRVLTGGERADGGDLARGHYARPTIVTGLPEEHELVRRELFVPILCAQRYSTLPEALQRANATEFGLTAGIFTQNRVEMKYFFDNIEFGVVYANRQRGGSTGAMVGGQAFTGWKSSGSTGKGTGSVHYLQQFLREQSRTVCR